MITPAQKQLAAKIAADLRSLALAVEAAVSDDPNLREHARSPLWKRSEMGPFGVRRLLPIDLETRKVTILRDACPQCQQGELQDGEEICCDCAIDAEREAEAALATSP